AATNIAPMEAIAAGKLREDLYYRLTVFHIVLPPLSERTEDIAPLAESMIQALNAKYGTRVTMPDQNTLEQLRARHWPGNVRELRNVMERAVILAGNGELTMEHLPPGYRPLGSARDTASGGAAGGLGIDVGMTIEEAERNLIEATLKHVDNNKTRAAMILGITTKTMHAKLRKYRSMDEETAIEDEESK
ncbi:MAG: helix-turn-helix domain-containing protein, partial [Acidobacteriota bacterium]